VVPNAKSYLLRFSLAIEVMSKKRTLKDPKAPPAPKAAYVMPTPNSDIAEYGWFLKNIRHADPKSLDKKDPDPGRSIFSATQETLKTMRILGHEARFICPTYLQILLDASPEIREAALRAANARYTKESIGQIEAAIARVFRDVVLPDIKKNFEAVLPMLAQFYAARVAHIKKFGAQTED
jgi:hypothetical protein